MADVIICVGDVFYKKKTIDMMKLRTAKAVELYKQGKAKKIIFSGGFKTRKDLSEAKFMAELAIKKGVHKKNIILEEKANNSIGNAHYSKIIMDKKKFKSAIIVTSPHNLKRARYIFNHILKKKKLEFEKCKSNLSIFNAPHYYMHEIKKLTNLKRKGIYAFGV